MQRLNQIVPQVASLPAGLLRVIGASGANHAIVFFAVVERRTSQALIGKRAGRVLMLTHTSVYLTDFEGVVTRMMRITEIECPLTVARAGSVTEGVILRVKGEPDVLIYFLSLKGSDSDTTKLAAEINHFNAGKDSTGAAFVSRLKALRDAYTPTAPMQIIEVPSRQLEAAASLSKPSVHVAGGANVMDIKDKVKVLEQRIQQAPPRLPPPSATIIVEPGQSPDEALIKAVAAEDVSDGAAALKLQQHNAALAERLSELLRENQQNKSLLDQLEKDKRSGDEELLKLQEENRALVEQQAAMQARIDELTDSSTSGRASAEDFSKLVQQLLSLQRQLSTERAERQLLVDAAVEDAKNKYNVVLLRQQDQLNEAWKQISCLEEVFGRMRRGVSAAAADSSTRGGADGLLQHVPTPLPTTSRSSPSAQRKQRIQQHHRTALTTSDLHEVLPDEVVSWEKDAEKAFEKLRARRDSPMKVPLGFHQSETGPPTNLNHADDETSLRYNLLLDT